MFIRILRPNPPRELLFNTDHISKIEITYAKRSGDQYYAIQVPEGLEDPTSTRCYRISVAGEVINIISDPDDPISAYFGKIYTEALAGPMGSAEEER